MSDVPKGLGPGGRALWAGIADDYELMPEQLVQLEEACRAKDRLDRLDAVLRGDESTWLSISAPEVGPMVLVVSKALSEANATANLMKQLLAALRLPDEEGRRPQYRGARGAQAPSVPGGAADPQSASQRAASRWGA